MRFRALLRDFAYAFAKNGVLQQGASTGLALVYSVVSPFLIGSLSEGFSDEAAVSLVDTFKSIANWRG